MANREYPSVLRTPAEPRLRKECRLRYFITFACYGARLHGDESGSVDRNHNLVGSRLLAPDSRRAMAEHRQMRQEPYVLDEASRTLVLAAIRMHCELRGWNLLAAHIRSNHAHIIVEAEAQPERIMNEFKSYASRELNQRGTDGPNRKRWARHGSTRWLWTDDDVRQALRYAIDEQGEPMAVFVTEEL
jgi:REP element-mobilizing transposase RayT